MATLGAGGRLVVGVLGVIGGFVGLQGVRDNFEIAQEIRGRDEPWSSDVVSFLGDTPKIFAGPFMDSMNYDDGPVNKELGDVRANLLVVTAAGVVVYMVAKDKL